MEVTMPQLGETVTEGTITRWFKQVGDKIDADEPLFEVSTDKVDSEVPAPQSGYLSEIVVPEGETVAVGARLAVISDQAGASPPDTTAPPEPAAETPPIEPEPAPAPPAPPPPPQTPAPPAVPAPPAAPAPVAAPVAASPPPTGGGAVTSPLVRQLIAQEGLDPAQIRPTGEGGRITRNDVLQAARARGPAPAPPAPAAAPAPAPAAAAQPLARGSGDETVPFDNIRRRTAEHMVRSLATSAHVYTSARVDFERIERVRSAHQAEWKAEEGFSLTYLPFIVRAFCDVVHEYPYVNASVEGETLIVHRDINLGIAVDLEFKGLIAPVIRNADGKRLRLIAREIRDLAARAKSKQLSPDEVVGGTFTITNMGPFGTTMTFPIINQPQVAIMATDAIRKEPVVVESADGDDAIVVHHVGYLSLTWDHRAFDGAYAASFLNALRGVLETRDWEAELA
ncbi:MAG TPA: dihydrolipoamide acetyltransferase family protein [Acidimicrobiia bacterium]|nr:dihydrolipoamide acetyltransferase family protein [Acidimicrobiia bacterium]